jgi:hypothetical protein
MYYWFNPPKPPTVSLGIQPATNDCFSTHCITVIRYINNMHDFKLNTVSSHSFTNKMSITKACAVINCLVLWNCGWVLWNTISSRTQFRDMKCDPKQNILTKKCLGKCYIVHLNWVSLFKEKDTDCRIPRYHTTPYSCRLPWYPPKPFLPR